MQANWDHGRRDDLVAGSGRKTASVLETAPARLRPTERFRRFGVKRRITRLEIHEVSAIRAMIERLILPARGILLLRE